MLSRRRGFGVGAHFLSALFLGGGGWTPKMDKFWAVCRLLVFGGAERCTNELTTAAIRAATWTPLPGIPAADPIIRDLLERAVGRLRPLCANLLHGSHRA